MIKRRHVFKNKYLILLFIVMTMLTLLSGCSAIIDGKSDGIRETDAKGSEIQNENADINLNSKDITIEHVKNCST